MDKEGVTPLTISNPQHEPLAWAVVLEEVEAVDPREDDVLEDHQAHQEDHRMYRPEETTIEIGMISKEMMKAAISLEK